MHVDVAGDIRINGYLSRTIFSSIHPKWECHQHLGPSQVSFSFPNIVIQHVIHSDDDNDNMRSDLLKGVPTIQQRSLLAQAGS